MVVKISSLMQWIQNQHQWIELRLELWKNPADSFQKYGWTVKITTKIRPWIWIPCSKASKWVPHRLEERVRPQRLLEKVKNPRNWHFTCERRPWFMLLMLNILQKFPPKLCPKFSESQIYFQIATRRKFTTFVAPRKVVDTPRKLR